MGYVPFENRTELMELLKKHPYCQGTSVDGTWKYIKIVRHTNRTIVKGSEDLEKFLIKNEDHQELIHGWFYIHREIHSYQGFELIFLLELDKVEIDPEILKNVNSDKVKNARLFVNDCKTYEPLIVEQLGNGNFLLVDGYHYYVVLKELGYKWARCLKRE
jgi:hypothetical protein